MTLSERYILTGASLPFNILLGPLEKLSELFDPAMTTALSSDTPWVASLVGICSKDLNTQISSMPTAPSPPRIKELSSQT